MTSPWTGRRVLSTESTLSAPQIPHPVRPVSRRVFARMASSHAGATVIWISMPLAVSDALDSLKVGLGPDQLLGDAEAEREVLQVLGRGHHDGVGDAVVDHRDRDFLRHRLHPLRGLAVLPAPGGQLEQGLGVAQA